MYNTDLIERLESFTSFNPSRILYSELGKEGGKSRQMTYEQFLCTVKSIAAGLQKRKMEGRFAIIVHGNELEFAIAFFACLMAGAYPISCNMPKIKGERIRNHERLNVIAEMTNPGCLFGTRNQLLRVEDFLINKSHSLSNCCRIDISEQPNLASEYRPTNRPRQSMAFMQFTSGSTSIPKGIMISHQNVLSTCEMLEYSLGLESGFNIVSWLPFSHDMGLISNVIFAVYSNASLYFMRPESFVRNPKKWLTNIGEVHAQLSGGPNFAYELCTQRINDEDLENLDLSSWRIAYCGAENIRYKTITNFIKKFTKCGFNRDSFTPAYGLAEATLSVSINRKNSNLHFDFIDKSSVHEGQIIPKHELTPDGVPIANCGLINGIDQRLIIVDPVKLSICEKNRIGEVWLQGSHIASGYWQDEEMTTSVFRAYTTDGEGPFLRTGDLGYLNQHNCLFITGRLKELIVVHGKKYSPAEIEMVLEDTLPEIQLNSCAIVQVDDNTLVVFAELNIRRCSPEDRLLRFNEIAQKIRRQVSISFSLSLNNVVFLKNGSLYRTSSGKIMRMHTRQKYINDELELIFQDRTQNTLYSDKASVHEFLATTLAKLLGVGNIPEDRPISTLGIDSIMVETFFSAIKKQFNVEIPQETLWHDLTINEIGALIGTLQKEESAHHFLIHDKLINSISMIQENENLQKQLEQIPQRDKIVDAQQGRDLQIDGETVIDFASCNYLGFDYQPEIIRRVNEFVVDWGVHPSWTRAVASPKQYVTLEQRLAELMHVHSCLVFPSIAMLNLGIIPLLVGTKGVVIADNAAHQTIHEACELAWARGATYVTFKHKDLASLETLLKKNQHAPSLLVAVDGIYSMDSEYLPLPEIIELTKAYGAYLYVDDAHGFGILGENPSPNNPYGISGNGIVNYYGMDCAEHHIIYIAGLSKAYASYAAFICCHDEEMHKKFKLASTYIFSGPIPYATLASSLAGLDVNEAQGDDIRNRLYHLSKRFVDGARSLGFSVDNVGYFPFAFIVVGNMEQTIKASQLAWEFHLLLTPGIFPAVPMSRCGLRFSITALHTESHIDYALEVLNKIRTHSLMGSNRGT